MTMQDDQQSQTTIAVSSSQSLRRDSDFHGSQSEAATEKEIMASRHDPEKQLNARQDDTISIVDSPPNGGYGWVCVACAALINAHTWGINSSYGVFLSYYLANNIFEGASSIDYALVGGLSVAAAMGVSPAATYTTGRWGTRTTLLIGVFLETLSLIAASFTSTTWQLFLTQGACFGLGMGFLFVGSVGVIPQWFTTKRSLANGCAAGGSGIGGLIYSFAIGAMIPRIGLPWTFRVLGIVSCLVNFTCAILMKDRNKLIGTRQVPFDYKLFKRWEYVLMEAWAFFSMLGYVVLLFSLPTYVVSVGLSQQQASVIAAMLNLGQGIGRPIVGMFSDVGGRINMAAILTFFCGLCCLVIWIFAKSYGILIFFSLLIGTVAGTIWTSIGPVAAEVVGLKLLPSALSMTWLVMMLPAMFSEAIGLTTVTASEASPTPATANDPYLYVQIYTALMYFAAAGCVWLLRAWKIGQMEILAATKGEDISAVDPVREEMPATLARQNTAAKSSLVRRLFVIKRV